MGEANEKPKSVPSTQAYVGKLPKGNNKNETKKQKQEGEASAK